VPKGIEFESLIFRHKKAGTIVFETTQSYTDEDIEYVREQRAYWARREQNTKDKMKRKFCQKYVKATNVVFQHMTGGSNLRYPFPAELMPYIGAIYAFATSSPRIKFVDVYGECHG